MLKRRLYLLRLLRVLLISLLVNLLILRTYVLLVSARWVLQGFFVNYDELSNVAPVHLEFFPDHLLVFFPGLTMTFITKVIMLTLY